MEAGAQAELLFRLVHLRTVARPNETCARRLSVCAKTALKPGYEAID